jgi:hypothetical protein
VPGVGMPHPKNAPAAYQVHGDAGRPLSALLEAGRRCGSRCRLVAYATELITLLALYQLVSILKRPLLDRLFPCGPGLCVRERKSV